MLKIGLAWITGPPERCPASDPAGPLHPGTIEVDRFDGSLVEKVQVKSCQQVSLELPSGHYRLIGQSPGATCRPTNILVDPTRPGQGALLCRANSASPSA